MSYRRRRMDVWLSELAFVEGRHHARQHRREDAAHCLRLQRRLIDSALAGLDPGEQEDLLIAALADLRG